MIMVINETDASDGQSQMQVVNRLFAAYDAYDVEGMLALHTDDAVRTWIDPGKNIPEFGPEGKLIATGKLEIRKFLEMDRGQRGYTGYILWSEVHGNTVTTIELWHNERARAISVPLITKSSYRLHGDKIAEWTWVPSPESTRRFVAGVAAAMIPFCWIVFRNESLHPREGYFLWIPSMILVLFSGFFSQRIGLPSAPAESQTTA